MKQIFHVTTVRPERPRAFEPHEELYRTNARVVYVQVRKVYNQVIYYFDVNNLDEPLSPNTLLLLIYLYKSAKVVIAIKIYY